MVCFRIVVGCCRVFSLFVLRVFVRVRSSLCVLSVSSCVMLHDVFFVVHCMMLYDMYLWLCCDCVRMWLLVLSVSCVIYCVTLCGLGGLLVMSVNYCVVLWCIYVGVGCLCVF